MTTAGYEDEAIQLLLLKVALGIAGVNIYIYIIPYCSLGLAGKRGGCLEEGTWKLHLLIFDVLCCVVDRRTVPPLHGEGRRIHIYLSVL